MTLKQKRNIWIFAGICFLLGVILWIFVDSRPFGVYYILNVIASILFFINAYNAHKKILHKFINYRLIDTLIQ